MGGGSPTPKPTPGPTPTPTSAAPTPGPPAKCANHQEEKDCDQGQNIKNMLTNTTEDCCEACTKTKDCNGYSWNKDTAKMKHQCYLHKMCKGLKDADKGVAGGILNATYVRENLTVV